MDGRDDLGDGREDLVWSLEPQESGTGYAPGREPDTNDDGDDGEGPEITWPGDEVESVTDETEVLAYEEPWPEDEKSDTPVMTSEEELEVIRAQLGVEIQRVFARLGDTIRPLDDDRLREVWMEYVRLAGDEVPEAEGWELYSARFGLGRAR